MATRNNLPNSPRWGAVQILLAALKSASTLAGVRVVHNPRTPASLNQGAYTVFVKDQADTLVDKAGQIERRTHQFLLCAVARTSDAAECEADALHEAAASALRGALSTLMQHARIVNLSEVHTQFDVASLEIDGAICLSTWELKYNKPAPV